MPNKNLATHKTHPHGPKIIVKSIEEQKQKNLAQTQTRLSQNPVNRSDFVFYQGNIAGLIKSYSLFKKQEPALIEKNNQLQAAKKEQRQYKKTIAKIYKNAIDAFLKFGDSDFALSIIENMPKEFMRSKILDRVANIIDSMPDEEFYTTATKSRVMNIL
ncbi:MAG TPA: hypothetical protein VLI69_06060 [Gammaproteobacteria bacterium]|nr:hypothetical protein [Gammaproteobacteria bacterium]